MVGLGSEQALDSERRSAAPHQVGVEVGAARHPILHSVSRP